MKNGGNLKMIWRMNQIQENKFYEVYNKVDGEFIFNRLAYNLNMDKETLLQYIDVENAKALLATLLINRNLDDNVDIINRPQDYLIDPHKLHNADKAAKVIHKYCKNSVWQYVGIILAVIWILLVGISRIWLGVHNLTDVIGAYLLGLFLLSIYTKLFSKGVDNE